ncbi:hypothetical protein [Yinghuangia sp. YIM S09857]|uniref:hypothetical protein n=1 Tax=Yinghuangia sp. YIM S09857 TaxID=3436929 RepID=UPI003F53D822
MPKFALSTPVARIRRGRLAANLVLTGGLLLSVAACNGADGGETTGSSGGGGAQADASEAAKNASSEIAVMTVCDLLDVKRMAEDVMKTQFVPGDPKEIGKGVGLDPAGPQCSAQLKLPSLRTSAGGSPTPSANARFDASVLAYSSAAYADGEFDDRVAKVNKHLNVENIPTPLNGPWTEGVLIKGRDQSTDRVYALVRKDSYLLKIDMAWGTDAQLFEKYPFTRDTLGAFFEESMTPFATAVAAKAEV